jgi:hypothetical protein
VEAGYGLLLPSAAAFDLLLPSALQQLDVLLTRTHSAHCLRVFARRHDLPLDPDLSNPQLQVPLALCIPSTRSRICTLLLCQPLNGLVDCIARILEAYALFEGENAPSACTSTEGCRRRYGCTDGCTDSWGCGSGWGWGCVEVELLACLAMGLIIARNRVFGQDKTRYKILYVTDVLPLLFQPALDLTLFFRYTL